MKEKIKFNKGIPSFLEQSGTGIKAGYESQFEGTIEKKEFDRVILSVGLSPNPDNSFFSDIIGINLDDNGFIETKDGVKTSIDGIFAVGPSSSSGGIKDSISQAVSISEYI